jgi:hypothetical protein
MSDRNKVLAHSDSDALEPDPVMMKLSDDRQILVPVSNWGLAPLVEPAVELVRSGAAKLLQASVEERMRLEPELAPYLRVVSPDGLFNPPT